MRIFMMEEDGDLGAGTIDIGKTVLEWLDSETFKKRTSNDVKFEEKR